MAKQTINIGTTANDGTGDSLRVAADKANDNFDELYAALNVGVFAALTEAASVVITDAETYYPVPGVFSNSPAVGFEPDLLSIQYSPAIKYTGEKTLYFEIDYHATLEAAVPNRIVYLGIKKNAVLVDESVMQTLLKTANEPQTISGTVVVQLETDDRIQLVVACASAATTITFDSYTTTIKPFIIV